MTRATLIDGLGLSIRAALAAGIALGTARLLRLPHAVFAMIAAVVVTDVTAAKTWELSMPRLTGTVLGAALGAAIDSFASHSAWVIAVTILAAMFITQLLSLPDSAKVAGYVCGIIVLSQDDNPWSYSLYRVAETTLGILAAALVSLVPKLVKLDQPKPPNQYQSGT